MFPEPSQSVLTLFHDVTWTPFTPIAIFSVAPPKPCAARVEGQHAMLDVYIKKGGRGASEQNAF